MKTPRSIFLLLTFFALSTGAFSQSNMIIRSGGSLTVNGNLTIIDNCGSLLTDARDGKTYPTIRIGNQCWMAANLNYGTRISGSQGQANNGVAEKFCYNDIESYCDVYGGLYQWNEMMQYVATEGTRGICPAGWHLPTDAEWTVLSDYLGGGDIAGGKMKETGTSHWVAPNTGASNSSGFTALPAGGWDISGHYGSLANNSTFLTSTQYSSTNIWGRDLWTGSAYIGRSSNYLKTFGFSVRCIKD
jgi:uncharacterized protein (TIGR02145 family)